MGWKIFIRVTNLEIRVGKIMLGYVELVFFGVVFLFYFSSEFYLNLFDLSSGIFFFFFEV